MNNKHMEFGKFRKNKTVKELRGLTDSLKKKKKKGENQPTLQQDQLTTLFIKQIQQFSFVHLIE